MNSLSKKGVEIVGYARLIVPLGDTPDRIDCIRLYEMELQRLKQELELLQMGVE